MTEQNQRNSEVKTQDIPEVVNTASNKQNISATDLIQKNLNMVNSWIQVLKADKNERMYGAIAYFPFFGLISLMFSAKSDFVKMHVRQGQFLFLIYVVALFFNVFLSVLRLDLLASFFIFVVFLAYIVVSVYAAYLAYMSNFLRIPVVYDLSMILPIDLLSKYFDESVPGQIREVKDDLQNRQEVLKNEESEKNQTGNVNTLSGVDSVPQAQIGEDKK